MAPGPLSTRWVRGGAETNGTWNLSFSPTSCGQITHQPAGSFARASGRRPSHFNAPNNASPDGPLSGTYKIDNGPTQNFGPIAETVDGNGHPDWTASFTFPPGSQQITILSATSPHGIWTGNGGTQFSLTGSGCVGTTPPSVNTVKTHTPAGNVAAGGTFHWLLTTTVANGPTNQPVHITDTLPAGMTAGAITLSGTGTAGKLTCTAATGNPDCTIATAAGNGTYIIDVTVTAPAANNTDNCHAYINTASANYGTAIPAGSPTDTVTVTGCANPGISILKTDSVNHTVAAGGAFNYVLTVTVTNGPTTQAYGIADTAPAGLTFGAISKTGTGDLTKLTGNASGSPVAWTLATGATNGTYILTIATTAPAANVAGACKLYTNTGSVTIVGVAPMTSSDDVTVTGCNRTLKIYKSIQGDAGDNTVFTTSVSGVGGTFPLAQNAHQETSIDQQSHTVTETLAAGYSNVSWAAFVGAGDICSDHAPQQRWLGHRRDRHGPGGRGGRDRVLRQREGPDRRHHQGHEDRLHERSGPSGLPVRGTPDRCDDGDDVPFDSPELPRRERLGLRVRLWQPHGRHSRCGEAAR